MTKNQLESHVGARIRTLREARRLSQESLAHEIGMSTGNVGKIERGTVDPNTATLYRIAAALNVEITDFFEDPRSVAEPGIKKFVGRQEFEEKIGQLWSDVGKLKKELESRLKAAGARPPKKKK